MDKEIIFSLFVMTLFLFLAAGCEKEEAPAGEAEEMEIPAEAGEAPAEEGATEETEKSTKELIEELSKEQGLIEETTAEKQEAIPTELSDQMPEELPTCDEGTTFLYASCYTVVKGSPAHVELSLQNVGRDVIEGFWLYITFKDGTVKYSELAKDLAKEKAETYKLDIDKWETEVGGEIEGIEVHAEETDKGEIKSCYNKRVRFDPRLNCHDRITSMD